MPRTNESSGRQKRRVKKTTKKAELAHAQHVRADDSLVSAESIDSADEEHMTLSQSIGRKSDVDADTLLAQLRAADQADAHEDADAGAEGEGEAEERSCAQRVLRGVAETIGLLITLYFFFATLDLLALAFKSLGKGVALSISQATENPLVGFACGLFLTVALQVSVFTLLSLILSSAALRAPHNAAVIAWQKTARIYFFIFLLYFFALFF